MPRVDITVEYPPLPEGWSGTPDELNEFNKENGIFSIEGDFPVGQVGGAKPTEDAGIWYSETSIETFRNGKYQPITDVPIGALLPWASGSSIPPENYLLADGRSLLRADYPELFTVIGITWGNESDTTFTLPDLRGRYPIGSGIGDYKPQGLVGRMKELAAGAYAGFEYLTRQTPAANAPLKSMKDLVLTKAATKTFISGSNPAAAMPWLIRYR